MADSPIVKPDIPDIGPTYDSYYTRYYFDFTSAPDDNGVCVDYRVNIAKRDLLIFPPTPIELQGGPSPFVLSLGNDSDPLAVTRTASAQISFFDDIDLSVLLPSDATQWRVELVRVSDGKRIFWGYLTAEVYTQPAIEGPNVITINAASPLVPILAEKLDTTDVGMVTIGRLIRNALYTIEGIDTVYMPAIYSTDYPTATSQYTDILRYTLSQAMYIHIADDAAITGVQYESDNYAEPLEALCRLFGWSMVDVGDGSLYFVMAGYDGKYMQLTFDDLVAEAAFTPILVEPAVSGESGIESIDTGDTVEYRQGVASVRVEAKATDINVEAPDPEKYVMNQSFGRSSEQYILRYSGNEGEEDGTIRSEVAKMMATVSAPAIKMHHYDFIYEGELPPVDTPNPVLEGEWVESDTPSFSFREDGAGASLLKYDWANPDSLNINANPRKNGWTFTPVYFIKEKGAPRRFAPDVPETFPLLEMRFPPVGVVSGAFCINYEVMALAEEGICIARDGYVQGGTLETPAAAYISNIFINFWSNYQKLIRASFRVGDHWWSGTRWVAEKSIFYLPISTAEAEWHPAISNKTVDMPYDGSEGVYIPITTPLSGDVEIIIYRTEVLNAGQSVSGYGGNWYLKGFTLEHKATIERAIPTLADTTYYRSLGNNFTEKKDVTLDLHSRINGAEQLSLIYKDATTPLDTLYKVTHASARKPEQYLLDEYERVYGRALQRWRRGMMLRELKPIDIFSRATSSSVLAITGYTADFDANTIVAYLTDVKKINKIHNVE